MVEEKKVNRSGSRWREEGGKRWVPGVFKNKEGKGCTRQ